MTTVAERISAPAASATPGLRRPLGVVLAVAGIALAGLAVVRAPGIDRSSELVRAATIMLWALAGASLTVRRTTEPMGLIATGGALLGALGSLGAVMAADAGAGGLAHDLGGALRWSALAGLPAVGLHLMLGLPDGMLHKRTSRVTATVVYAAAAVLAVVLWALRPSPAWPVWLLGAIALIAATGSSSRYKRSRGLERQRMQWFGWAVTVGAVVTVIALALAALADLGIGWSLVAIATAPIPVALAIGASKRFVARVDRMLAHTVAIAGLSGLIVGVYVVVVVGLGDIPDEDGKRLLLLSMGAAAVAALLYIPTRDRLTVLANRIAYGELHAPDEVLRSFGSRLSRSIPMDELLLQMAESLRKTFALDAVEVWTGQGGALERSVSLPERGHAKLTIGPKEQPVLARAGVTGPAWLKVWLPQLLAGHENSMIRVAPVVHSGELLGFILVERYHSEEQLGEENERVLTELARQAGLALHNVQLDSALQETLDEVRRQAEDLRASRERVVKAADQARRKIERDLHDGAQQNLVALAVKVKLLSNLVERDPAVAKGMISDLAGEVQDAVQALRDLAHGIYPPVLADRGLVPALQSAAGKAPLPTTIDADGEIPRFSQEIEAAVYFCSLEALNNAGKHAGADAEARIKLWIDEGVLFFEASDNGPGFDMQGRELGSGFTNMMDRLGAVGGMLVVDAGLGRGTTITGRIPILG